MKIRVLLHDDNSTLEQKFKKLYLIAISVIKQKLENLIHAWQGNFNTLE